MRNLQTSEFAVKPPVMSKGKNNRGLKNSYAINHQNNFRNGQFDDTIISVLFSFLSDPGPVIVYACQSLTNWRPFGNDVTTLLKIEWIYFCWWQKLVKAVKAVDGCNSCHNWHQIVSTTWNWYQSCRQLGTVIRAGNSLSRCQSWRQLSTAVNNL